MSWHGGLFLFPKVGTPPADGVTRISFSDLSKDYDKILILLKLSPRSN
jgi:hypothetical protein